MRLIRAALFLLRALPLRVRRYGLDGEVACRCVFDALFN